MYPGESFEGDVKRLKVIERNTAVRRVVLSSPYTCPLSVWMCPLQLRLRAVRPFVDEELEVERTPGDEWLFVGPGAPSAVAPRVVISLLLPAWLP